jgi:hypothetical protein
VKISADGRENDPTAYQCHDARIPSATHSRASVADGDERPKEIRLPFCQLQVGRTKQFANRGPLLLEFYPRGDIRYDVAVWNEGEPEMIRERSAGVPRAIA